MKRPSRLKTLSNTIKHSRRRVKRYAKPVRSRYFRRLSKNERLLVLVMAEMMCNKARLEQIPIEIKKVHRGKPLRSWSFETTQKVKELKREQRKLTATHREHSKGYVEHLAACRSGARLGTFTPAHSPQQAAKVLKCDASVVYRVVKQFIQHGHTDFEQNRKHLPDSKPRASLSVENAQHASEHRSSVAHSSCVDTYGKLQKTQEEFRQEPASTFPYLQVAELQVGEISKFLRVKLHSKRFEKQAYLGDIIDFGSEPDYDYTCMTVEWLCNMLLVRDYYKEQIKPQILGWTLRKLARVINNSKSKLADRQEELLRLLPKEEALTGDYSRTEFSDEPCSNFNRAMIAYYSALLIMKDTDEERKYLTLDYSPIPED